MSMSQSSEPVNTLGSMPYMAMGGIKAEDGIKVANQLIDRVPWVDYLVVGLLEVWGALSDLCSPWPALCYVEKLGLLWVDCS